MSSSTYFQMRGVVGRRHLDLAPLAGPLRRRRALQAAAARSPAPPRPAPSNLLPQRVHRAVVARPERPREAAARSASVTCSPSVRRRSSTSTAMTITWPATPCRTARGRGSPTASSPGGPVEHRHAPAASSDAAPLLGRGHRGLREPALDGGGGSGCRAVRPSRPARRRGAAEAAGQRPATSGPLSVTSERPGDGQRQQHADHRTTATERRRTCLPVTSSSRARHRPSSPRPPYSDASCIDS